MAFTPTTRAGLKKPLGNSPQDVAELNFNADAIDFLLGQILVNAGVTPGTLIDGAIVKERTTGVIWTAQDNGAGGYNKAFTRIKNPLVTVAFSSLSGAGVTALHTAIGPIAATAYARRVRVKTQILPTVTGAGGLAQLEIVTNGTVQRISRGPTAVTCFAEYEVPIAANDGTVTLQARMNLGGGGATNVAITADARINYMTYEMVLDE